MVGQCWVSLLGAETASPVAFPGTSGGSAKDRGMLLSIPGLQRESRDADPSLSIDFETDRLK